MEHTERVLEIYGERMRDSTFADRLIPAGDGGSNLHKAVTAIKRKRAGELVLAGSLPSLFATNVPHAAWGIPG
jgi:hypothetical protein